MTNSSTPEGLGSTILGYPRIGPKRELKKALERYWAGKTTAADLESVAAGLRADTWRSLSAAGLESIPGNTFSYYDHILDNAVLFNAVPQRYRELGLSDIDTYFALARGNAEVAPLEMTKWFDTNYHYLVPEIGPETEFRITGDKPFTELAEAAGLGIPTRPALPGPVTFLLLSKANSTAPAGFSPLDRLDDLVAAYAELLTRLSAAGAEWVQLDEPSFVADRTETELAALRTAYETLGALTNRPRLLVTGPYGDLGPALEVLASTPVEAIGLDLVAGTRTADQVPSVPALRDKTVVAGIVDGHNVWRTDPDRALAVCATLLGTAGAVVVGTSCSLLHVPYDVKAETEADPRVLSWLAFAEQKVAEVVNLQEVLRGNDIGEQIDAMRKAVADRRQAEELHIAEVRDRMSRITGVDRHRGAAAVRAAAQRTKLGLPALPTTTIGSFPQTTEVRTARADLRAGRIDADGYQQRMRTEIERVIRLQEDIGLDVLVHGEPERNDMVQYFAEKLRGFISTEFGWVQSYGSRCVRPPILYGDVSRPEPMTVEWSKYAQSLTDKPVKGMLTGPVTILAWSFVRDDQPIADTANQVAIAIADEVQDLEQAGIGIVQVDEPALRELLPLRARDHEEYLHWAVDAFRLATGSAADSTAIHTHMCYSEFGEIISAIDGIDADVTSIEAARSKMEIVDDLREFGRGVGPGVYDIHSPRVPDTAEIAELLRAALTGVNAEWLWVNPDCGLKTRGYAEVEPALRNMVDAANTVRAEL